MKNNSNTQPNSDKSLNKSGQKHLEDVEKKGTNSKTPTAKKDTDDDKQESEERVEKTPAADSRSQHDDSKSGKHKI